MPQPLKADYGRVPTEQNYCAMEAQGKIVRRLEAGLTKQRGQSFSSDSEVEHLAGVWCLK